MKKSLLLLLTLTALACSKEAKPGIPSFTSSYQPSSYSFFARPGSLTFSGEGGTRSFQLSTEASWNATCEADWVGLSATSGTAAQTISVTVPANPGKDTPREATVFITVAGEGKGVLYFHVKQRAGADLGPGVEAGQVNVTALTGATIACSYTAAEGGVNDHGILYGTSESELAGRVSLNSDPAEDKDFNAVLRSLEPNTTYYYRPFIQVLENGTYTDILGEEIKSFTTTPESRLQETPYLNGYEVPAVTLRHPGECSGFGPEVWGGTRWYQYECAEEGRIVVTHTYRYDGKTYRNWTALVDKNTQGPLWVAGVMNNDAYPRNDGVGRANNWVEDPGIPAAWQRSVANNTYSRGHHIASNYRQTCDDANNETFYYTNQALQFQNGFNSGVWSSLEQAVVNNTPAGSDTLYVVIGTLWEDPSKTTTPTGYTQPVQVPSHFYKCLMKCSFDGSGTITAAQGCAYLFTNESHTGMTYSQAITSIDAVETRAGFDFFAHIPETLQSAAESSSTALW